MILIPDIHINAKYGDKILAKLEELFARHADREVIFLGDYVYMFSYDRSYLLKLFKLFTMLYKQGRTVRIMAGNHDWIQGQFVFEEGKHLREMFENDESNGKGSLQFITQCTQRVDETNNLHVVIPYNDHLLQPEKNSFYNSETLHPTQQREILEMSQSLSQSSKKGEQLSALINTIALTYYETNKDQYNQIIFYHHYYTANQFFPGVKTQFHFRDAAFHPAFMNIERIKLISGHIHEPFSFQNYLCCGSFWHTSSLEKNEIKYYFVGDVNTGFEAHMNHINPKISLDLQQENLTGEEIIITDSDVQQQLNSVIEQSKNNLQGPSINNIQDEKIIFTHLDVTIQTVGSTTMIQVKDLSQKLHHIDIKKIDPYSNKEQFSSVIESDFRSSFTDRKQLLSEYLHHKYGSEHDSLIDFLYEYNIIGKNTLDTGQ